MFSFWQYYGNFVSAVCLLNISSSVNMNFANYCVFFNKDFYS